MLYYFKSKNKKIYCFLIFVLTFISFVTCNTNYGINNDTLIQSKDADAEYSAVAFLKQIEYYPRESYFFPRSLHPHELCNRHIYYEKKAFRNCMKELTIVNLSPSSIEDLLGKMDMFVDTVCGLKKIILFKDSIYKGELNTCEISF